MVQSQMLKSNEEKNGEKTKNQVVRQRKQSPYKQKQIHVLVQWVKGNTYTGLYYTGNAYTCCMELKSHTRLYTAQD